MTTNTIQYIPIQEAEIMGIRDLFLFKIGDEVTLSPSGITATVTAAIFKGKLPVGFYNIIYSFVTPTGEGIQLDFADIKQLSAREVA